MGRIGRFAVIGVLLAAACSGRGGNGSAAPTTTTSTTSTTQPTTTTTTVEDAVRAAWLGYWRMIDRLVAAPNPDDPELVQRATDPILSLVRDDMATRRSQGRTTRSPANAKYAHHIQQVTMSRTAATVADCFIDDRVQYSSDGKVLNDHVSTVKSTGTIVLHGSSWIVSDVVNEKIADGPVGCAS